MASRTAQHQSQEGSGYGIALVFLAGVLWSTVGLGIRLIEDAVVWQILLYRSASLTLFLFLVLRARSGESPFVLVRRAGWPAAGCSGAVAGRWRPGRGGSGYHVARASR